MSDEELRARLHAADPAPGLAPVDPDRLDRLLEDTMTVTETREDGTHDRSRLTWLVAAAVVVVMLGAGVVGLLNRGVDTTPPTAGQPTTTTLRAPSQTSGRCMVPSARTLRTAALAFDGTVLEVDEDRVVFSVAQWYTGQEFDRVEVAQSPPELRQLLGAATFSVGDRYLVAGNREHELMVCGFTAAYSSDLADLYSAAFDS